MDATNAKVKAEYQCRESQTLMSALQRAHKKKYAATSKLRQPELFQQEESDDASGHDHIGGASASQQDRQTLLFHCYSPSDLSDGSSD